MIHFVTTRFGRHTIHEVLATGFWTQRERFRPWTYEEIFARLDADEGWLPPAGLWVWTDHERLDPDLLERACELADVMAAEESRERRTWWPRAPFPAGPAARYGQLNPPSHVLTRYALLSELHRNGTNDYRAVRVEELPDDLRFPVFLRLADDHRGPRSALLHDREALDSAIRGLPSAPQGRRNQRYGQDWLVVEYIDVRGADALYRKYSAIIVGRSLFARHLFTGEQWMVKFASGDRRPELRREERAFIASNPHRAELAAIFALAGISFGRIDYSVLPDGRLQIWEINTNPSLGPYAVSNDPHRFAVNQIGVRATLDRLLRMEQRVRQHQAGPPLGDDAEQYTVALRAARPGDPRPPPTPGGVTVDWERQRHLLDKKLRRPLR